MTTGYIIQLKQLFAPKDTFLWSKLLALIPEIKQTYTNLRDFTEFTNNKQFKIAQILKLIKRKIKQIKTNMQIFIKSFQIYK